MNCLYLKGNPEAHASQILNESIAFDSLFIDPPGENQALIQCIRSLQAGDTLYLEREQSLTTDFRSAVSLLHSLAAHGINVYVGRKNVLYTWEESPFRELNSDLADDLLRFRNAFTRMRQAEGYKKAKEEGRKAGRGKTPLPDNFASVKKRWLAKEIPLIDAAAECEMAVSTFWVNCRRA